MSLFRGRYVKDGIEIPSHKKERFENVDYIFRF